MGTALQSMSRQAIKRQILDALDEGHKFDVPQQLVDAEFSTIWERVKHEVEHHGRSFEDEGTTEEEARAQYQKIAERRVRLGLVVAEIGNKNSVEVTEDEHQQALIAEVRRSTTTTARAPRPSPASVPRCSRTRSSTTLPSSPPRPTRR